MGRTLRARMKKSLIAQHTDGMSRSGAGKRIRRGIEESQVITPACNK